MASTAPAPSRATNGTTNGKSEARASVPLQTLFDDVKEEQGHEAKEDVKKRLHNLKKAGSWDSEGTGTFTRTMNLIGMDR